MARVSAMIRRTAEQELGGELGLRGLWADFIELNSPGLEKDPELCFLHLKILAQVLADAAGCRRHQYGQQRSGRGGHGLRRHSPDQPLLTDLRSICPRRTHLFAAARKLRLCLPQLACDLCVLPRVIIALLRLALVLRLLLLGSL